MYELGARLAASCVVSGRWKSEKPRGGNPTIIIHRDPLRGRAQCGGREDRGGDHLEAAGGPGGCAGREHRGLPHRVRDEARAPTLSWSWRTCTSTRRCPPNVQVNLTCLVPTDNRRGSPPRSVLDLLSAILRHFLRFPDGGGDKAPRIRAQPSCSKRIHILEGFVDHLRRARPGHPDHPPLGGQEGRGRKAHEELRSRCAPGRRHPGAQALQAWPSWRSSSHPERVG